jgi:hypothetical protein
MMGDVEPSPSAQVPSHDKQELESLLEETERRLATRLATVNEKGAREVLLRLALVVTMLDQFARTTLIHLPEIPPEGRKQAGLSGERRHRNWRRIVSESVEGLGDSRPSEFAPPGTVAETGEDQQ